MTARRSMVIIANPVSGRRRGRRTAESVAAHLRDGGVDVAIKYTQRTGDAQRLAHEISTTDPGRIECVVACGGDGTLQEVANALAPVKESLGDDCSVMGLAPAGRCNDLARALGVPTRPAAIADILLDGNVRNMDLGRANGRYFCTVATLGIDAEVSSFVDSMRMPLTGTLAYLYGALRVLVRYQPQRLVITGDFGRIEQPVFLASTANTSSYGGSIPIAPDAVPTDGQLDLCVIRQVSKVRALVLVPAILLGRHRSLPEVRFIRTGRLTIDAQESLELWADGERLAHTPVTIQVVPNAIRIMLP